LKNQTGAISDLIAINLKFKVLMRGKLKKIQHQGLLYKKRATLGAIPNLI